MIKLNKLKGLFKKYKIDGYIVPKNDEFFGEYIPESKDNLRYISNFSGSYGFALILQKKNYLFVDGRYSLQAKIQSGSEFNIVTIPKKLPSDILKNKKISIGFDPKLHTELMISRFFKNTNCNLKGVNKNLITAIWKNNKIIKPSKFYKLSDKNSGQRSKVKIKKIKKILNKNKIDFQFISAPENVAWLLNLRGSDSEFTPIPNSYLILSNTNKIYFFCDLKKIDNSLKKNLSITKIFDISFIEEFLLQIKHCRVQLDSSSCSIF